MFPPCAPSFLRTWGTSRFPTPSPPMSRGPAKKKKKKKTVAGRRSSCSISGISPGRSSPRPPPGLARRLRPFARGGGHATRASELDRRITERVPGVAGRAPRDARANILRVGVYELEEKTVPREVAINEAVVLAKRYATDDAARLVNGVLARVAREQEAA